MSTIELVDPELRDALAQGPLLRPLTAKTLRQRRASGAGVDSRRSNTEPAGYRH
jgi:hypothetical protein